MIKYITLFLLLFSCSLSAQYEAEEVTFLGTYDDDSLPTHFYGTFNDVWGYAANGREYAFFGSASYIHIFDVTDPTNLVEITKIAPGNQTVWRDFKTYGNYLYAVADNAPDGLIVIDLSGLPAAPTITHQNTNQFESCHNIYIDEANARLYTAGAGSGTYVYSLSSSPEQPVFLGEAFLGNNTLHDIYVRDNIAYCSAGNPGFFIYDLTDISQEKLLASAETNGYNHSSWLSDDGTFAFFAEEVPRGLPLGIMDLCDMENGNIEVNNYFKFPLLDVDPGDDLVTPHNPFVLGDYVYVSYYRDGLHIYDISNPENVTRVGYFDAHPQNTDYMGTYAGTWGCYPYLPSGNILLSDMDNGLFVVDFNLDNTFQPGTGTLCAPSSSSDIIAQGFSVSPNPSNGMIQIEIPNSSADYTITAFSITGKEEWSLAGEFLKTAQLDLTDLASGIYILEIRTADKLYREKVVLD